MTFPFIRGLWNCLFCKALPISPSENGTLVYIDTIEPLGKGGN